MTDADRPRVVFVVTAAITARLFVRAYVEHLAKAGYEVTLVADDLATMAPELRDSGVCVRSVRMRRAPHPVADVGSLIRMFAVLRELRPDAVIYATPKASMLTAIISRILRVPTRIYELWGIRFETATGLSRAIFRGIERTIVSSSTVVLANSASLASRAIELGIVSPARISVLGAGSSHGVDAVWFSPSAIVPEVDEETRAFQARHPGFTIGYVGRLHRDKGIETLIAAADLVAARGYAVRVLLVGGEEGAVPPSARYTPVHRTGEVDDVRPYVREFDVLALLSRREGFPNVVLEAAAMQVPAVVSDATGCVDAVVDGVTGYVVPVGDTESAARAFMELIEYPARACALGGAGRRRVIADFDPVQVRRMRESHLRATLLNAGFRPGGRGS